MLAIAHTSERRKSKMALTRKKIKVFDLGRREDKQNYENLLNDINVSHIIREEFSYSKRTDQPLITVWYEEYTTNNNNEEE